jgi:hypothetical protein
LVSESVISCPESSTAVRVIGGAPLNGSTPHSVSAVQGRRPGEAQGHAPFAGHDPLGAQELGQEGPELQGVAVGEVVDLAAFADAGGEEQTLAAVAHMAGGREVAPAAHPTKAPLGDHHPQDRHERGVAVAPDEARAHHHHRELRRGRGEGEHLSLAFALGVEPDGALGQRRLFSDEVQRVAVEQHGLGADVGEARHARVSRGLNHRLGALDVHRVKVGRVAPVIGQRRGVNDGVAAAHAFSHRGEVGDVPTHDLGPRGAHGALGLHAAGQGADLSAFTLESLDQLAAQEA